MDSPEDEAAAPHQSGFSRQYFEDIADSLLEAIAIFPSADGSRFSLPDRESSAGADMDGLEGFARSFLLAAFRIPHAPRDRATQLAERYRRGLVAGTARSGSHAWPPILAEPVRHQAQVEAASIALGLWATRTHIWDRLADAEKADVAAYLERISMTASTWNNWYLFRAIVLSFLESVGMRAPDGLIDQSLAAIEPLYRAPGWYVDGTFVDGTQFDYYSGWAHHFYTLLWSVIAPDAASTPRAAEYRTRATQYARDLLHMIGGDGAPIYQGRSLLYRSAIVAPLWALELAGGSDLPSGTARHAAGCALDYFRRHGAFDTGIPSLGWHQAFAPMIQAYSGAASPLWLSKTFLGLLLPPDHPAWVSPESALPVELDDYVRAARAPGVLLHGTKTDGVVRMLNGGIAKDGAVDDPFYDRLAYSTITAPTIRRDPDSPPTAAPDNWCGYFAPDGTPSLLGSRRVLRDGRDGRLSHYVACHLSEPDQPDGAAPRTVPAIRRDSWIDRAIERRDLLVVRRGALTIGATGFCLSDAEALTIISGRNWIGVRTASGMISAIIDLTGRAALAVEERDASPFGARSALPIARWTPTSAAALDAGGLNTGASALSLGVALGRVSERQLDEWADADAA